MTNTTTNTQADQGVAAYLAARLTRCDIKQAAPNPTLADRIAQARPAILIAIARRNAKLRGISA